MSISTQVSWSETEGSRNRVRSNGEDHISNLPESIISYIFSCMPIKDAVRTCVLSKDWEYKWTSISDFDIDDRLFYSGRWDGKTTFVDFVKRILLHAQDIRSFRLRFCGEYKLGCRMTTWISALLRRNIKIFELHYDEEGVVFPRCLNSNSSLRELELELPSTFEFPFENYFLNLTSLSLDGVRIRNELSNTDTVVLTLPVLETLELRNCKWLNAKFVEIHAPALRGYSCRTEVDVVVDDYSIKIFGSRLARFSSYGCVPENLILIEPPVVFAALYHEVVTNDPELVVKSGLQFRRLLRQFPSLEDLELDVWVIKALAKSKQGLAFPRYDKLKELFLAIRTDIEALLELLHSAPFLKCLVIETEEDLHDYDYDAVESLPPCIVSHLEKLVFYGYAGKKAQANLAKFLLKNAVNLQECCVNLDIDNTTPEDKIRKRISRYPKASNSLSVIVKQTELVECE